MRMVPTVANRAVRIRAQALILAAVFVMWGARFSNSASPNGSLPHKPTSGSTHTQNDEPTFCDRLDKTLEKRVAEIYALQQAVERRKSAPPENLLGLFKSWTGQPHTPEYVTKTQEQLIRARNRAETINGLRASSGCGTVNIDTALREIAAKKPTAVRRPNN